MTALTPTTVAAHPASVADTAMVSEIIASSNPKIRPRMWSGTIVCSAKDDSVHCPPPPRWPRSTNTPARKIVGISGTNT
jgi:hypothetical protein